MNNLKRKRSAIWNHFTVKSDIIAKCSYCGHEISYSGGSTSNLLRHLKTKHVAVPLSRPSTIEENVDDPSNTPSTSATVSTASLSTVFESAGPLTSSSNPSTNSSRQSSITQFISKPISLSKSKAIDLQITKFILKHFHPFSIVEETEFRNLIKMLAPNYTMPSRKTISNSLLLQMYESTLEKVKAELNDITALSLTTDGWTSINNEHFIALTVHFINSDTVLCSRLIGCINYNEKCTSEELANFLMATAKKWKIEYKISAVVTDNAPNIVNAIRLTQWRHVPCFAHVLNIGIQHALNHIKPIINKIKNIVEFFKQSSGALHKLQNIQKQSGFEPLKLIQECKTRWNSAFKMMERIIKLKEPVLSTLAITNNSLNCISDDEWEIISSACTFLQVFDDVTTEMSSENTVTISKQNLFYIFLLDHLHSYIQNTDTPTAIVEMANEINTTLTKYFKNLESNDIQSQSILLDPRFKKYGFSSNDRFETCKSQLARKLQNLNIDIPNNVINEENQNTSLVQSSSSIWKKFDDQVNLIVGQNNSFVASVVELDKYLSESLLSRQLDPLKWWSSRKQLYPRLYEIVKRRLCVPATSVPSERIFSKAGLVLNSKRTRLTTSKVEKIIFIQSNM